MREITCSVAIRLCVSASLFLPKPLQTGQLSLFAGIVTLFSLFFFFFSFPLASKNRSNQPTNPKKPRGRGGVGGSRVAAATLRWIHCEEIAVRRQRWHIWAGASGQTTSAPAACLQRPPTGQTDPSGPLGRLLLVSPGVLSGWILKKNPGSAGGGVGWK